MDNTYLLALYGWIFFNVLLLGLEKDKVDDKRKPFNFQVWWKYHWDNILITLLAVPVVVEFTDDLWKLIVIDWIGKEIAYNRLSLLGAVPLVQLIYYLIRKISK